MKDGLFLLLAGTLIACCSWFFWHYLGEDGFSVLSTLILLALVVDNIRLRRKLKGEQ